MAKFDPNGWYAISETRVDKTNKDLKSSLQLMTEGMRVHPIADDLNWQLHPVDDKKPGRYVLRSFKAGVQKHLAACRVPAEKDSSRTRACLEPASSDESQQWDISDWGDGTYKIQSVANGTRYWLDVHPGSDVHLSSVEETPDNKREAQHWVFSSRFPVNDDRYSTLYSEQQSTIAPASTTTASSSFTRTTPTLAPTATDGTAAGATDGGRGSSPASEQAGGGGGEGGLSTAAAAGVGVGVTLAVLAAIITLLIFWWRRRQAAAASGHAGSNGEKETLNYSGSPQPPYSGVAPSTAGAGAQGYYSGKDAHPDAAGGWQQQQQQQQHNAVASPDSGAYYYHDQAKSPQTHVNTSPVTYASNLYETSAAPMVVHEAPGPNMPVEMDGTGRQPMGYRP
ncbi:hypothetical protein PpBr36_00897 [Pyricularia pennisetigena]|uniref:hypothetical protein n=1 Tax=Pyricularia pennisetigena TaxID=1578925 RepID=UPI0011519978|nr:hypothetical protein PpBr36_00897 [Pyricularia pennisetigena]TLS27999.1 hypothetical protein PpBr36_00897 [Pyricularia pennisetigena]